MNFKFIDYEIRVPNFHSLCFYRRISLLNIFTKISHFWYFSYNFKFNAYIMTLGTAVFNVEFLVSYLSTFCQYSRKTDILFVESFGCGRLLADIYLANDFLLVQKAIERKSIYRFSNSWKDAIENAIENLGKREFCFYYSVSTYWRKFLCLQKTIDLKTIDIKYFIEYSKTNIVLWQRNANSDISL